MTHIKPQNLNYWLLIGIAFLAAVFSVLGTERQYERELAREMEIVLGRPESTENAYALIDVDFGNGSRRRFRGMVDGYRYTLAEALNSAAENGSFSYTLQNGAITELAEVSAGRGLWRVYKNGAEQKVPVEKLLVSAGDQYVLRYE